MTRRLTTVLAAATATLVGAGLVSTAPGATAAPRTASKAAAKPVATAAEPTPKVPVATGYGGAVSSVDADASAVGIQVLKEGGNAVDAAVATAAALGVTEPYSAGVGGGGYFVYYDAKSGKVQTIDGRETAPLNMRSDSFVENGTPIPFADAVTSGLSVGVPGTPATWDKALDKWGKRSLRQNLQGAIGIARDGFVVDETFRQQTADNAARFARFTSTRDLYLPGGAPPAVGTVFRNPDLADTYDLLARRGVGPLYDGVLADDIVATVKAPPTVPGVTVRPGLMEWYDLARYQALVQKPTWMDYRSYQIYSMAPSSSGGTTVGEALGILERFPLSRMTETQAQHHYLEASALAFADRNRWVGDPAYVRVPEKELLSDGFADERACQISPTSVLPKPVAPGSPDGSYSPTCGAAAAGRDGDQEGLSTTHLVTADRWGNFVSYTLTIEQTGGSGIVVPGRGFLLNNELTDFNFTDTQGGNDPNLPAPGKRPRSSMSPTIVLRHNTPVMALGSPGGATIITTVLQALVYRLDLGYSLPEAVAAPRASQRNTAATQVEPAFVQTGLAALGHTFTSTPEIGAMAAIERLPGGQLVAAAEPVRRGGGSAMVVRERP